MKRFFLAILFFSVMLFPVASFADDQYFGLEDTATSAGLTQTAPSDVPTLIGNIIGTTLSLIGVIFFVLMVYGGFLWMTAHGDSARVDKGKETIIAAVIGLVVVLASYALTTFVFNAPNGGTTPSPTTPVSGGGSDTSQCESVGQGYGCRSVDTCLAGTAKNGLCPGDNSIKCCIEQVDGEQFGPKPAP